MSTNETITTASYIESSIVAYYALTLIIVGTILNLFTFLILCRARFRDTRNRPVLHYMRAIALFDIFMLYGWNLDHYLTTTQQFFLLKYSLATCKLVSFISYFTPQISAWLRVFICLDRYFALSRRYRTPLIRSKTVLIIILSIVVFFFLLNLHILLFVCYHLKSGRIGIQAQFYKVYPMWDYVNLALYNCAPLILMVILNSAVIHYLIRLRRTTTLRNSRIPHRTITLTLIITTFLFLFMTIPASVAYAFFTSTNSTLLHAFDGMLYTYHILSFPLYFFTFNEFRYECLHLLPRRRRIQPEVHVLVPM